MNNTRIYAVRNTKTGKLVSNLGSRHKKYWDRKGDAIAAMKNNYKCISPGNLKIVEFVLVEVDGNV
jgi:hypothetical protein